ncbi:SigE family RNA polymerase sigma factor [Allokutzneria sp. NRRL B-24872]|uniref:SigE family RNA polymerase sigma factor n=1 Tax=Allokutzneria sp. NRRL B-24872 TaxID=1137961 RepID=UPI000A3C5657|nr:SigE family RNA polymerase sigma factor [Allokutzneria sp. NRRL B-24872]
MTDRDAEFVEFVQARGVALRRTAFLLCGDWHRAEDLVQAALIKLFKSWHKIQKDGSVDAYARQVLVRTTIDESRRFWRRRERASAELPEVAVPAVSSEEALDLRRALAQLPARQRAVVVLRFWEDQSVEEVANLLGCAQGTVKSQASKGLAALRKVLADQRDYAVLEVQR